MSNEQDERIASSEKTEKLLEHQIRIFDSIASDSLSILRLQVFVLPVSISILAWVTRDVNIDFLESINSSGGTFLFFGVFANLVAIFATGKIYVKARKKSIELPNKLFRIYEYENIRQEIDDYADPFEIIKRLRDHRDRIQEKYDSDREFQAVRKFDEPTTLENTLRIQLVVSLVISVFGFVLIVSSITAAFWGISENILAILLLGIGVIFVYLILSYAFFLSTFVVMYSTIVKIYRDIFHPMLDAYITELADYMFRHIWPIIKPVAKLMLSILRSVLKSPIWTYNWIRSGNLDTETTGEMGKGFVSIYFIGMLVFSAISSVSIEIYTSPLLLIGMSGTILRMVALFNRSFS